VRTQAACPGAIQDADWRGLRSSPMINPPLFPKAVNQYPNALANAILVFLFSSHTSTSLKKLLAGPVLVATPHR
jgi:hypothetical protein